MEKLPHAISVSAPSHFVEAVAVGDSFPPINEGETRHFLSSRKWPLGLQDALIKTLKKIPIRFFICDDSSSMMSNDGSRLISSGNNFHFVTCSRWKELGDSLIFHAELSQISSAVSEFRFLNKKALVYGYPESDIDIRSMSAALEESPCGGTPLCRHIKEIIQKVKSMESMLISNNQKACIIIATDGESSDGNLVDAMRPLQALPVWVVVRLCTNDDQIVDYWNNIDNELELDMDVLDDLSGEASEITSKNPWMVYGEPFHRLREFGIQMKEIDIIDERKLSADQMRAAVACVLGGKADDFPHPEGDWDAFVVAVKERLSKTPQIWCPLKRRMHAWIDVAMLSKSYKPAPSCSTM